MATKKAGSKTTRPAPVKLETGQRWAYPLGSGRYVALQITERLDDSTRAIAFEPLFDGIPTSDELDRAPHLRFDLAIFNRGDADTRVFARFGLDADVAPVRATLVDVAPIREDAEVGYPNIPYGERFHDVHRSIFSRPAKRWHSCHRRARAGSSSRVHGR
jgi:hypothetical protein